MELIFFHLRRSLLIIPVKKDWVEAIALLILYAVIYLPIGFSLNFLTFQPEQSWQTILSVTVRAFFMPGLLEELVFRGLLIPLAAKPRTIAFSWLLFVLYHLHPFVPAFFRTPAFLIGAGLLGIVCTISYLRSRSLWGAIVIHWSIVVVWLLVFGGLVKF